MDGYEMTLAEFSALPTTVDFQVVDTARFREYARERPYLRIGTEFANSYSIVYTDKKYVDSVFADLGYDFFSFFPVIMSPVDSKQNDAAGITQVLGQPYLDLSGEGVVVGIVDTGIDYTDAAFMRPDGSTKILAIWDQTVGPESGTEGVPFGAVYSDADIDAALSADDPYGVVPSSDEDGHGTFLASVAAGGVSQDFSGAAPDASIVAVKLRRARQAYIERYLLSPDDPNLYESTDFMLGVKFVLDEARKRDMPAVICVGMGSNFSAHDGSTPLEEYISFVSERAGYAFVTAAGNESNARRHTQGRIERTGETRTVGIRVGEGGASFSVMIFAEGYDSVSVGVASPTGETLPRTGFRRGEEVTSRLIMEETTLRLKYYRDESNVMIVGFEKATEGVWNVTLFGDGIVDGGYWMWLPISGQTAGTVEFLRPVPETTVVFPANAARTITCGAYDPSDGSLYAASSWGPTRLMRPVPDLVAPGVNVSGIYPYGRGTMTGTSAAAAVTAGAAALLLEWSVVKGNMPSASGDVIRTRLIAGCDRDPRLDYPDPRWGFGRLDLYGTFRAMRETIL